MLFDIFDDDLTTMMTALALALSIVIMPVGAARTSEKCQWEGIEYLDIEIEVI
ncbi:hypothetical protein M1N11_05125 [Peptococcaceae bacterium]|nr:hypothetical protein [Peptococcaceae bacterium]